MILLRLDGLSDCIPHTELPGTSKLFADLLYHFERVQPFYAHAPFQAASYEAAARQIQYPDARRAAMAQALAGQNPPSELLTRFAQPGTVAVVTGQQVGLFGGPAYTVYKALTAAKLAANLTARGISAVPIFWMATEDHDIVEVSTAWTFDSQGHAASLSVSPTVTGQKPAGTYWVGPAPLKELEALLNGFEHGATVVDEVKAAYTAGATMGSAFRALVTKLLGSIGVLVLDPLDPAIRAVGAPLLADAVSRAPELKAGLLARGKQLTAAGYHTQVLVEEKTSLFFLLDNGERKTLRLKDSECASLAGRAADVSPNALLRPVWQDFMLPTVAYVGGPGELAYFAQSAVLFEKLLGRMPVVVPRACFTILDARAEKLLKKFGLTLADAMVKQDVLRARIAQTLIPVDLASAFAAVAGKTTGELDELGRKLAAFDPTLAAAMAKSRAKVQWQIEKLRRKTERETLRRDARATADAAYLIGLLYPEGHLQERLHSILPFLAKYGMDLVDRLYQEVQPDCPDHRVLTL